jgi:hypothetical protein
MAGSFSWSRRAACAAALLAACSPVLNWRDVQLAAGAQGAPLRAQFPCKPERVTRQLQLDGMPAAFTLLACEADGMTFSIGGGDIADPARVPGALRWLQARLADNIGARPQQPSAFAPRGATPHESAQRFVTHGRLPAGADRKGDVAVEQRAAVFARGTQVFQAVVWCDEGRLQPEAAEQFFASIEFR